MNYDDLENVMKASGIPLHSRRKLVNSLIKVSAEDMHEDASSGLPLTSEISKNLIASGFDGGAADRIVATLVRSGHARDDAGIGTMHASGTSLTGVQRQAFGYAERYGIAVHAGRANPVQVDEALKKRNVSLEQRMYIKSLLAQAQIID
jgi:hypothetical protein